jgi:hypothetical protein
MFFSEAQPYLPLMKVSCTKALKLRRLLLPLLQKVSELPAELALHEATAFLARLVKDPTFLEAEILPLLEDARVREEEGWYVAIAPYLRVPQLDTLL